MGDFSKLPRGDSHVMRQLGIHRPSKDQSCDASQALPDDQTRYSFLSFSSVRETRSNCGLCCSKVDLHAPSQNLVHR